MPVQSIGKGEVDSSILSGSTSPPVENIAISDADAQRKRVNGGPSEPRSLTEPPLRWFEHARFWSKVEIPDDNPHFEDGCWIWRRSVAKGYGQIKLRRWPRRAHRIAYEIAHGPIPDGLQVLHSCDNPRCVNPQHLRVGTAAENMAECKERGRVWYGGSRRKDDAAEPSASVPGARP